MRSLLDIAGEYERAELTALWIHDRATKRHLNVLSVVELCPTEQAPSAPFSATDAKSGTAVPLVREALDETRTAYVTRAFFPDVHRAVAFFQGDDLGRRSLPTSDSEVVNLESLGVLTREPSGEAPVLIPHTSTSVLTPLLPARRGSLRLWSLLDVEGVLQDSLDDRSLTALVVFARDHLGLDLGRSSYAFGSIHLCMTNPILRDIDQWITNDNQSNVTATIIL